MIPKQTQKQKVLTLASLAKSQFEPLCLTFAPRANTAIWLDHPVHRPLMTLCTEEYLGPEMRPQSSRGAFFRSP